jgi:CRP-like cAMP-binding protein
MAIGPNPAVLRGMTLFKELDAEALSVVIRQARTRRIKKGERIFSQGEAASACHAVVHGCVRIVQQSAEGKRVTLRRVMPGEMFGLIGLFVGGRYPADAIAAADCVEIRWSESVLAALMRRYPQIALNVITVLGQRLSEIQNRLREALTERVEQRIARTLLRLAERSGARSPDGGSADIVPASQRDLAEMAGATHYTVSRALRAWTSRGLVRSRRNRIEILDPAAVRAIAEDLPPAAAPR